MSAGGPPGGADLAVRLRPGVWSATGPDGVLHLLDARHGDRLGPATPGLTAVLRLLATGPRRPEDLRAALPGPDAASVPGLLDRLDRGGWLATTAGSPEGPLWTVEPVGPGSGPEPGPGAVLSRFAVLRRDGGDLVLESPLAEARIRVHDPALLPLLADPGAGGRPGAAGRFRRELARWGFLTGPGEPEQDALRVAQWSPHELWFHAASRLGRHHPAGAAGPPGRFPPPPAARPAGGPAVDLRRADLDRLRATDPPLTAVLEDRRSVRRQDDTHPLTAAQLGEFLDRCAAVRAAWTADGVELSRRPYPSGGARYELDLYLAVHHVAGLAPGFYRYDPYGHRLEVLPSADVPARRMLALAATAAELPGPPQVLVVVAARFGRLMGKYRAFGYALVLKHVGALVQVMYSVATAMGLAPCALGVGDADAFAAATGADPLEESSVGEFVLGSAVSPRPDGR